MALVRQAPISAREIESMLTNEKESPLFKEYNAALLHLAALEKAQEVEFFLQAMERMTALKLEDEAAAYASYYNKKKQEETIRLIEADNKTQQRHVNPIGFQISVESHLFQLALTALAYTLSQWLKADQQVAAAAAAQNVIAAQWQAAHQGFIANVINNLNALGVNPALVAQVQNQLNIGQPGQLPLQAVQRLGLIHIQEAYNNEVNRQLALQAANGNLDPKQAQIAAEENAAKSMRFADRTATNQELVIHYSIKNDKELLARKRKEFPKLSLPELIKKLTKEVFDAKGYVDGLFSAMKNDICQKAEQKFAKLACERYEEESMERLQAAYNLVKNPEFKEFLQKIKPENVQKIGEAFNQRFGLSFSR